MASSTLLPTIESVIASKADGDVRAAVASVYVDYARYWIGLFTICSTVVISYWFSIHPWVKRWRRVGQFVTLLLHLWLALAVLSVIFQYRDFVMFGDRGTPNAKLLCIGKIAGANQILIIDSITLPASEADLISPSTRAQASFYGSSPCGSR